MIVETMVLALLASALPNGVIWREAERIDRQEGSRGEDLKTAASDGRCLGHDFGAKAGHFAEWTVGVPETLVGARCLVRYAREPREAATWDFFVDGARVASLRLPGTGGWGEPESEWKWEEVALGDLGAGSHVVRLVATATPDNTNVDGFFIAGPDFSLPVDAASLFKMTEAPIAPPVPPTFTSFPAPPKSATPRTELPSEVIASLPDARLRHVIEALAKKPVSYLLKAYDVGVPTDYDSDFVWHDLGKEKLFDVDHATGIALTNPNTDLKFDLRVILPLGEVGVGFSGRCFLHTVDALAYRAEFAAGLDMEVLVQAVSSQSMRLVVVARNESESDTRFQLLLRLRKNSMSEPMPVQRFGGSAIVTTGGLLRACHSDDPGFDAGIFSEWQPAPRRARPAGSLLACVASSLASPNGWPSDMLDTDVLAKRTIGASSAIQVPAHGRAAWSAVIDLSRFADREVRTPRGSVQCFAMSADEAVKRAAERCENILADPDWVTPLRASLERYASYPEAHFPDPSWEPAFYASLELPRAETYSPHGAMTLPFYDVCRAHSAEPWSRWRYGMRGPAHLSTFCLDYTNPSLSAAYLRGHFLMQAADGGYPYGVSPYNQRETTTETATPPFLGVEAWNAYLWSGDSDFLREAYDSVVRSHRFWKSARDRTGEGLCHWANLLETVRDDPDLPTWQLSGGAEYQEALDLNCYLLREEQVLAEMADEIGDRSGAASWRGAAIERARLMNGWFWKEDERAYYGRNEVVDQWINVKDIASFFPLWCGLPDPVRADSIVAMLCDPNTFATPYPVATLAKDEPLWGSRRRWHGSNGVATSFLVAQGLRRYGYFDEAARLSETNSRMVFELLAKIGHFCETYDSLDGGPGEVGHDVLLDTIGSAFPAAFLVEGTLGVEARRDGLAVLPALPGDWPRASLDGLSVRGRRVSVSVRRDVSATLVSATIDGRPAAALLHGRGVLVPWSSLRDRARIELVHPPEGRMPLVRIWPGVGPAPADDAPPTHAYPADETLRRKVLERLKKKSDFR